MIDTEKMLELAIEILTKAKMCPFGAVHRDYPMQGYDCRRCYNGKEACWRKYLEMKARE